MRWASASSRRRRARSLPAGQLALEPDRSIEKLNGLAVGMSLQSVLARPLQIAQSLAALVRRTEMMGQQREPGLCLIGIFLFVPEPHGPMQQTPLRRRSRL